MELNTLLRSVLGDVLSANLNRGNPLENAHDWFGIAIAKTAHWMSVERRSLHDQLCPVELYLEIKSFVTKYTKEKLNGRPALVGDHFGLLGKEGLSRS
jgi:hypothetical protein